MWLLHLGVHTRKEVPNVNITHRDQFGELLNSMGLLGCAVEVGVHRGEFSRALLDTWRGMHLFLIDPWEKMPEYENDPTNGGDRHADMDACISALSQHRDRWIVLRRMSADAAHVFLDNYLDFVYIDANHNEQFVRQDLELWYPKVKTGGIFAGHDYCSTVTWPGVRKAVDEFCARVPGVTINVTGEPGGSWWIVKP